MSEEELQEMLNKEPVELLWDKIHSLQQENKELKEEKQKLIDTLSRMPLEKTLMQCEIDTYKERIDKARKYIEENCSADNRLNLKGILKPDFDFEKGNNAKNIKIPAIKDLKDYLEGDK